MKNLNPSLKLGLMMWAMCALAACSSSKVEETNAPVETADAILDQAATTDVVPELDPALQTENPENLVVAPEPAAPVVDAPITDVPAVEEAPITENTVAEVPALDHPVVDTPVVENPVVDAPLMEETPLADAAMEEIPSVDPAPMAANDGTAYQVKKGDTLMKIAFEQYGDLYRWKEIYESNRGQIQDPNHVPPGTQLTLNGAGMVTIEKNGESYLIKRGDTLGLISNDVYGTTRKWKRLWENNRQLIKDPNKIYAGFYLYYVPEGKKRLTHEDVAPGLKDEDSAAVTPQVGTAPRAPASTSTNNTNTF